MFMHTTGKSPKLPGGLGLASLLSVITMGSADAAIAINADGKVKIFGDVRVRLESDQQTTSSDIDRKRDRTRYRVRLGASYRPNDTWSGKFRLATTSTQNSPHVTFSTVGKTADLSIGVDTALLAYSGLENLTLVAGKTPLNFWQQTEVFWDADIHPEAFAAVYQRGPVTLNAAYAMLQDGGWDKNSDGTDRAGDITGAVAQVVYSGSAGSLKYTLAAGGLKLDDPDNTLSLNSDSNWSVSGQLKSGPWLAGVDYLNGSASDENTAYVIQGRYKINSVYGVRAYYYHVEANATPGDGLFTQDNFPSEKSAADNFEGFRLQLDAKVANNTSMDLRYYSTEAISKENNYWGQAKSHDRLQLNINVKF